MTLIRISRRPRPQPVSPPSESLALESLSTACASARVRAETGRYAHALLFGYYVRKAVFRAVMLGC